MKEYKPEGLCHLAEKNEYDRYFDEVTHAFQLIISAMQMKNCGAKKDIEILEPYLAKMLYTITCLKWKFYENDLATMQVDLTGSGLPSFQEISNLKMDVKLKGSALTGIPGRNELLKNILDSMLCDGTEPAVLMNQMRQRQFYDLLDEDAIMLPFVHGELEPLSGNDTKKTRQYLYHWGCYDFVTNLPYIHILTFDQDKSADPFEKNKNKEGLKEFIEVIKREGSRVPDLGILGTQIDNELYSIHPKILKRICIGPIYSPEFSKDDNPLTSLFRMNAGNGEFALLWKTETLISKSQKFEFSLFGKNVHEIFDVPEHNIELLEEKATQIEHNMLLPHTMLQVLRADRPTDLAYRHYKKYSYDQKGQIYESR
jgi:hypothetical protein